MTFDLGSGTVGMAFVGAIFGIIIFCVIGLEERDWLYGTLIYKGSPLLGITLAIGLILTGAVVGSTFPAPYNYTEKTPIYSAADAIGVSGEFVLGTGSVNTNPVFIYYTGDNQVGYKLDYKDSDISRIFTDTNINPYLQSNCIDYWNPVMSNVTRCTYEFHVPNNSVRKEFNFDLGRS